MSGRGVILGAGGHAKVIIEIFRERNLVEIVGCVAPGSGDVLGVPILGDDAILPELRAAGVASAFVAIGNNRLRLEASQRALEAGFKLLTAISARAIVSPSACVGAGVAIMPGVVINAETRIGDGAIINTGATVDHDCEVCDYAHLAPGVHLAGSVVVGRGALIGIGASVVPGVAVGPWSIVGAGSVAICDLPSGVTAVGVPAHITKDADRRNERDPGASSDIA